jgi:hypothetical protein
MPTSRVVTRTRVWCAARVTAVRRVLTTMRCAYWIRCSMVATITRRVLVSQTMTTALTTCAAYV